MPRQRILGYDDSYGGDTIGDLIRQRGDIYARGALESGDIWGRAIPGIINQIGAGLNAYGQYKQEQEQRKKLTVQAQAVNDAIDSGDVKALFKILPPDKAATVAKALETHAPDANKKYSDRMALLRDAARGVEALPEGSREKAHAASIQSFVQNGVLTPEEGQQYAQYNPDLNKQLANWGEKPKEAKQQEGFTLGEGQVRYGPNGEVIAQGPEKQVAPKEAKPTWGQPFTGPDGISYQRNEQSGEIRQTPGVGAKPHEEKPEKPSTGQEKQALSYYTRAEAANKDFGEVEKSETYSPTQGKLWGILQGEDEKLANTAKKAFMLAHLRKESGATISDKEFKQEDEAYFPQPTDTAAVLKKKQAMRQEILNGLAQESGRAYKEHFGQDYAAPGAGPKPIGSKAEFDALPSGAEFIAPDGSHRRKP